ncbi:MAG: Abi family protein [Malacoplasma sp.]|nr:Abi family protein [Malacoplasma sp.]
MVQMSEKEIREFLQKLGLKIENWIKFSNFLSIFPFERIIKDYFYIFLNKNTDMFYEGTTDTDIISLIMFDREISSNLLKWLLIFETKFKKIIIEKWVAMSRLRTDKIYLLKEDEFLNLIPDIKETNLDIKKFRYSLFEHVSNSEFLQEYHSLEEIPIVDLSYSWTFATTINFYRVVSAEVKREILAEFNIPYEFKESFHKALNVLLKIRNTISHNHIIYNFKTNLYRLEFNKVYKFLFKEDNQLNQPINLNQIMSLVDYLLNWKHCKKEFENKLKDLKIFTKAKESLIKLFYGLEY